MTKGASSSINKRAAVLSLVIMAGAGHFVEKLQWDRSGMWEGSQRYLRDTNLDVITAEAIVWIHFLMGRFWFADRKKDHEMSERVGHVPLIASQLTLSIIEELTGCDFKARWIESRKLYLEAMKDKSVSYEPFATTVLRSVGCRSLAEPLKTVSEPLPPPEWTPLTVNVSIFFSTMPSAFYETFKRFLIAWSDRFPHDEDFDDDSTDTRNAKSPHDFADAGKTLGRIFFEPDIWHEMSKLREFAPGGLVASEAALARIAIIRDAIRRLQPHSVATQMLAGVDQYVAEAFAKREHATTATLAIQLYEQNVLPLTRLADVLARRSLNSGVTAVEIAPLLEKVATEAEQLMKVSSAAQKLSDTLSKRPR
jgi:hypothetical protein